MTVGAVTEEPLQEGVRGALRAAEDIAGASK